MFNNNQVTHWNVSWPTASNQNVVVSTSAEGGTVPYPMTNQQVVSNIGQQQVDVGNNFWNANMQWYQQMWPQQQPWMVNNFQSYAQQGSGIPSNPGSCIPQDTPSQPPVITANHVNNAQLNDQDFQTQFNEWEQKFQKWKEENKNHPDKNALAQYEAQWKSWRDQYLQNYYQQKQQACSGLTNPAVSQTSAVANSALYPTGQAIVSGIAPCLSTHYYDPENNHATGNAVPKYYTSYYPVIPMDARGNIDENNVVHQIRSETQRTEHGISIQVDQAERISTGAFHERPSGSDSYPSSRGILKQEEDSAYFRDSGSHSYSESEQWRSRNVPRRSVDEPRYHDEPDWYRDDWASRTRNYSRVEERTFVQDRRYPENDSSNASQLFKRRALHGKNQPSFSEKQRQEGLAKETVYPRSRIEERLALHAGTKLYETPAFQSDGPPMHETYPLEQKQLYDFPKRIYDPKIFEYHHRPTRVKSLKPFCLDYFHGKKMARSPHSEEKLLESQNILSSTIPAELKSHQSKDPSSKPAQLFPSASAIDDQDSSMIKSLNERENAKGAPDANSEQKTAILTTEDKEDSCNAVEPETIVVEDLLLPPGRYGRPGNILIILRGLPGSGKSYLARLIKEKELEMGGSAPRILSIDDYYVMLEDTGPVAWSLDLEEQYRQNLLKSLKRNLDEGHFSFVIVDALHLKADEIMEVFTAASVRSFSVFLAELRKRNNGGFTRKCSDEDLEAIAKNWEEAPKEIPRLDVTWFFKEKVTERTPSPEDRVTSTTSNFDEDSQGSSKGSPAVSKWEMMEQTEEKLDRLDGIVKRKTAEPVSVEDWLQSGLPEEYILRKRDESGKKRVRWADVEEKLQQEKMRDMGFVVGHTDWSKMTNTTSGESALTQTKYI